MKALRASDMIYRISSLARVTKIEPLKNLFCEFNEENLKASLKAIDGSKARGIDNVSKKDYEKNLDSNIKNLMHRLHNQSYVPKPKKEVLIPKADGTKRPIAIACTEDKVVERLTADILTCIYDSAFSTNSFGYRKGLSCHHAIKKAYDILDSKKKPYHYVVEIDLAKFFNTVNHNLLMKIISKRIGSVKLKSLIHRQLTAKVENEDGMQIEQDIGTPQGGIVSPILANLYLHHAIDEWFDSNYKKKAEMIRYADDCIFMFKTRQEAEDFLGKLRLQLAKFKLKLNEEKTRVIDFNPEANEIFEFLGLTFYRGRKRKSRGRLLAVKTSSKKLTKAFSDFTTWIKKNRNAMTTKNLIKQVNSKLRGHYEYYGFWCNRNNLSKYFYKVQMTMFKWLNRRSQKKDLSWEKFKNRIAIKLVAPPEIINLKQIGWNPYANIM